MTGWNKLIGGTLSLVIVAQFCHGVYAIFWMSLHASKSHNDLVFHVRTYRFLVELIQIDLDVFKVCGYKLWKIGAPIYFSLTIFFGTPHCPAWGIVSSDSFDTHAPHVVPS